MVRTFEVLAVHLAQQLELPELSFGIAVRVADVLDQFFEILDGGVDVGALMRAGKTSTPRTSATRRGQF